ncbi:MAG: branched-chain amino acid transporter AzlC [Ruminococcaceae bacterium]|nr:branched-chain amino acid transporter AzlC [Oscillospiraceae bacterium]MBR3596234.1 AzlC family ABC transporter permease [Clostridia bacterium]
MSLQEEIKNALKATFPVFSGYIVLGFGFGIVLHSKGFGILWALCMSLFIYAGSMQYVAIDLLSGGASVITMAITTVLVNARHLFYGISMIDKYKKSGKLKPYLIFALTDETYSLVCTEEEENSHRYHFLVSLFNHIYWVSGSVIGAAVGSAFDFAPKGIDFALTALFVTVFVEQWMTSKDHAAAIIGILSSVFCLIVFGADSFLIPAMLLITLMLTALRFIRKRKGEKADA